MGRDKHSTKRAVPEKSEPCVWLAGYKGGKEDYNKICLMELRRERGEANPQGSWGGN